MKLAYKTNQYPTQSMVDCIDEIGDLAADYKEFCEMLKANGNYEIVPLLEFAKWRNEQFEEQGEFTNPIPSIH